MLLEYVNKTRDAYLVSFFILSGGVSFAIANLLFAKVMNAADYGRLCLVLSGVIFLSTFSLLGIHQSIIRYVAQKKEVDLAYKKLIVGVCLFSLGITVISCKVFTSIYHLGASSFVFMLAITFVLCFCTFISSLLRANQAFFKSQFVLQFWRISLLSISVVSFVTVCELSYFNALIFVLMAGMSSLLLSLFFADRFWQEREENDVNFKQLVKEGMNFFGIICSMNLMNTVDRWMIPKLLDYESLAGYLVAWWLVGSPFSCIQAGVGYVLMPTMAKQANFILLRREIKINILVVILVSIILGVFLLLFSDKLLFLFYKGKYKVSNNLILIFALTGMIKLIYAIPSAILGGKGTSKELATFNALGWVGVIIVLALGFALSRSLGILAVAVGILGGWTARLVGGGLMSYKTLQKLNHKHKNGYYGC